MWVEGNLNALVIAFPQRIVFRRLCVVVGVDVWKEFVIVALSQSLVQVRVQHFVDWSN